MKRFPIFSGLMLISLVLGTFASATAAAVASSEVPQPLQQRQQQLFEAVEKVRGCVVGVADGMGVGSGVIVSEDGIVLTASHVVENGRRGRRRGPGVPPRPVTILFPDGSQYQAEVLGRNADADAAVLKISEPARGGNGFPYAPMGRTSETDTGEWCFAMGHPGGYRQDREAPVRFGRVLSVGSRTVVSDCAILLGDSGGPLFDLEGRVIGIHSMITSLIIENRHVAIDAFHNDWDRLLAGERWGALRAADNGLVESGFFGVQLRWKDFVPQVEEVIVGSPAEKSGLKEGDVLLQIGGGRIADRLDLATILALLEAEQSVEVRIRRGPEELQLQLVTGPRSNPDEASDDNGKQPREDDLERDELRQREILEQLSDTRPIGRHEKRAADQLELYAGLAEEHRNDVVAVRDGGPLLCLGTVMSSDGYILTKASEIDKAIRLEVVLPKGGRFAAKEVARDVAFDLALLKVEAEELDPVDFRSEPGRLGELALVQDPRGRPAIPTVISVVEHEMENSRRPFLGIRPKTDQNGVRIEQVIPGGAAEKNGLRANDVILSIGGQNLQTAEQLMLRVQDFKPGDRVAVRYMREEQIETIDLVLTPRFTNENPLLDLYDTMRTDEGPGRFANTHAGGFPRVLQIDADVYPSKVGGPLLDLEGRTLGIVIARADRFPTYVIPASSVQEVFQNLRRQASEPKPMAP
ncbi:MAG: putative periplasmic serine endoprotease DegP-like precursor [Planctomycetota bacterium]